MVRTGPEPPGDGVVSVIAGMIESIQGDRPRWKPDEGTLRTWLRAFRDEHSEVLEAAVVRYLKLEKTGSPTVGKIQGHIDAIKHESKRGDRPSRYDFIGQTPEEDRTERATIRADLATHGDPIRDWLDRHEPRR